MWNRSRPHNRREGLFGGNGAVLVWNLCVGEPQPPFGAILACELEGGASVGTHRQPEFAEALIVLEGAGVARVDGTPVALQPGVVVQLTLGATLSLENGTREHPLRYLIVKSK